MKLRIATAAALAALLAGAAHAADPGTLTRAESLRDKPFADAKVLAPVASGAKVDIVKREGGWYQITAAGKTGWVRMLSVRRSAAATGTTAAGIAGVASGRTGTGKVVATTGVRGLDNGELDTAAFSEVQIAQAEKYRVKPADAAAFAKQGGLVTVDAPSLPDPDKKDDKKKK
ncbi:MAG: SH3 domain-containing protein [Pseudomonadota bacterium]